MASRVAALQSALLREAETRDLKKRTQALTLVRWLSGRFRLSRVDAGARVRAAEAVGRHAVVQAGLASGAVTAGQAEVLARVLDTVAAMPGVADADRAAAGRFLVAQCETLAPRDLARAGKALVEALTVTPSEDDPADKAALEREQARAEAEAQERERNFLTVTRRRGKLRAILEPGTIGEAILARFLHDKADKRHPGSRRLRGHPATVRTARRRPRRAAQPGRRHTLPPHHTDRYEQTHPDPDEHDQHDQHDDDHGGAHPDENESTSRST